MLNKASRRFGLLAILNSLLLSNLWAQPATSLSDWQHVRSLPPGENIWVRLKTGEKYHGPLISASADSLAINSDERRGSGPGRTRRNRVVPRDGVREVRLLPRGASALMGGAIGMGVGAAIGLGVDLSGSGEDGKAATALLGLLGALLGAAIGRHATIIKGETIYKI